MIILLMMMMIMIIIRQALLLSMIILLMMMMMMIIRQALLDLFIELARRDEESRKKRWIESTGFPFHINYVLSILSIKSFKAEHSSCHQLSPRFTVSVRGEELSVGTKLGFTKWGLTKVDIFQD